MTLTDRLTSLNVGVVLEAAKEAAAEIERQRAAKEVHYAETVRLEKRLEVNHDTPGYDGISARDETIAGLESKIRTIGATMALMSSNIGDIEAENKQLRKAMDQ